MHMILAGDLIYKAFLTERNVLKYNKNNHDDDDDYDDDGNNNDDGDDAAAAADDDDDNVIYESSNLINQSINLAKHVPLKMHSFMSGLVVYWLHHSIMDSYSIHGWFNGFGNNVYIFLAFVICTSDTLYHCIVPLVAIYHGSIFWCQAKHITHGICDNASYFCLKPHASLLNHAQHAILDTLSYTGTKVNCYYNVEVFTLRLYMVKHMRKVVILI